MSRSYIFDAMVLIDYCTSDTSGLKLFSSYIGQIYIPTPVLDEVRNLDEQLCKDLNLALVEPMLEDLITAVTKAETSRMSTEDRVCFLMAKSEGWTCVTNDKRLRSACEKENLNVLWGLEPMLMQIDADELNREVAKKQH